METYRPYMEREVESILYIETDIPPQMTCSAWRRSNHPRRRRLFGRVFARRSAARTA